MNFFRNMKAGKKFAVSFAVMVVINIVVGAIMVSRFAELKDMFRTFYADRLMPAIDLGELTNRLGAIRINALRIVNEQDAAKRQEIFNEAANAENDIERLTEKLGSRELAPEEKIAFEELKEAWKAFNASRLNTYNWALQGKFEEAKNNVRTDAAQKFKAADEKIKRLIEIQSEVGVELYKESFEDYLLARNIAIGATIFMSLIAIILGLMLTKTLAVPMTYLAERIKNIAGGDLSLDESMQRKDEVGALHEGMNNMVQELNGIIKGILTASKAVASTVDSLRNRAEKTVEGARNQAGQAAQIVTAAEEMSQTITDIAKNAATASEASAVTMNTADKGKEVADGAVETVNRVYNSTIELSTMVDKLNSRAAEIGGIVTVIKDIADQTNLLALNAAIEAARAGEQGRGFAVVADEVRKLAERTIKATTEISGKIGAVQADAERTTQSMDAASGEVAKATSQIKGVGEALNSIVDAVQRVRDQITSIATAVDEQSAASEEVVRNIENTSAISREVEEMSSEVICDVTELTKIAEKLRSSTRIFKVS